MRGFIWSAFLSGLRSYSFQVLFIVSLLVIALSMLSANFSARHPETLLVDVGYTGVRVVLTLMTVFWVQELVAKDIERKTVILVLSYPQGRATYLLGRYFGIAVLIAAAVILMSVLLWIAITLNPIDYAQSHPVDKGLSYWISFCYMMVDLWVVAAFTLLIATLSTTPMLPLLLGIAFAVASHAIGPTADFLRTAPTADDAHLQTLGPVLDSALMVLPDMDRLDIRNWSLYGVMPSPAELFWPLLLALSYIGLMLVIAMQWFKRRDFV